MFLIQWKQQPVLVAIYIIVGVLISTNGTAPVAWAAPAVEYQVPPGSAPSLRVYFPAGEFVVPTSADEIILLQTQRANALKGAVIWVEGHCDKDEVKRRLSSACRYLADRRAKATAESLRLHGWLGNVKILEPHPQETTPVDGTIANSDVDVNQHALNRYVQISIGIP